MNILFSKVLSRVHVNIEGQNESFGASLCGGARKKPFRPHGKASLLPHKPRKGLRFSRTSTR